MAGPDDRWPLLPLFSFHEDDPENEENDSEDTTERPGPLIVLRDRCQGIVNLGSPIQTVFEADSVIAILFKMVLEMGICPVLFDEDLAPAVLIPQHNLDGIFRIEIEPDVRIAL